MAVNVELWQPTIIEELHKSNEFLATLKNTDEYVVGGSVVHIPQSGGPGTTVKNRTVFPGTISRRSDTDVVYALDEYTTDPRHITNIDQVELSYDKMASVVREETEGMMEVVGDNILYDISKDVAAVNTLPTTGANAAATAPDATGTRKILTRADLQAAKTRLNKQNVPKGNRFLILPTEMYDQLMSDNDLFDTYQKSFNQATGEFGMLYGFQIIERSTVLRVDAAQAVKAVDAANAATDSEAALFYHSSMLERALGTVKVFERPNDPEYYGDIVSFLIRAGARANRADKKGYGIIYQAA